jgi:hypothetical protein
MPICPKCSRSFEGDRCPACDSAAGPILSTSPVPDTGPWWSSPTDFVGWKYRIGAFLLLCFGIVWTVKRLGKESILLGALALAVAALVIWRRYRDSSL